jgi:hypothetical protein
MLCLIWRGIVRVPDVDRETYIFRKLVEGEVVGVQGALKRGEEKRGEKSIWAP